MPGEKAQLDEIEAGIKSGALSMEVFDDAVKHILDYVVKTNAFRKDIHVFLFVLVLFFFFFCLYAGLVLVFL